MPVIKCPRTGCKYETTDLDAALAIKLLELHSGEHAVAPPPPPAPAQPQQESKAEKIRRPSVEAGVTLEKWDYFLSR